jgi:hypothetical protein
MDPVRKFQKMKNEHVKSTIRSAQNFRVEIFERVCLDGLLRKVKEVVDVFRFKEMELRTDDASLGLRFNSGLDLGAIIKVGAA